MKELYALICVDFNYTEETDKVFTYSVPNKFKDIVEVGQKVIVPFGNRKKEGVIIELLDITSIKNTKQITKLIESTPIISKENIQLAKWISDYYLCSLNKAINCLMIPQTRYKETRYVIINKLNWKGKIKKNAFLQNQVLEVIDKSSGRIKYDKLVKMFRDKNIYNVLNSLLNKRLITIDSKISKKVKPKTVKKISINENISKTDKINLKTNNQETIFNLINEKNELSINELKNLTQINNSTIYSNIKKFKERGLINIKEHEVYRNNYINVQRMRMKHNPTKEQKNVLELIKESIQKNRNYKFLIFGVTGSGKTEVYFQSIEQALEIGKSSIILIPEISLTTQMVERFKNRFGELVSVFHSKLSNSERYYEWRRVHNNESKIVIGPRSAIFAPVNNLGLVVIDEEHEPSYKQDDDPKYHAREVAEKRIELENATLVLGSATPSVETYYKANKGYYKLLKMSNRFNKKQMPTIKTIDMRKELDSGNRSIFSRLLYNRINLVLNKGKQAILFLNRRGYSTFVLCRSCGNTIKCPHCDITLTYHTEEKLSCHYCFYQEKPPNICPICKSKHIRYFGTGTQKVELLTKKVFPKANIQRLDFDTTRKKGVLEKTFKRFQEGEIDILVGTQMIAKGLNFFGIELVGIITADTMLNLPDFRSTERTYQLITQVSGRTGRGDNIGEVIVQTYNPDNYAIVNSKNYNYENFYTIETNTRKKLSYPPFSEIISISFYSEDYKVVYSGSKEFYCFIRDEEELSSIFVSEPQNSPISKIKNKYRKQILIKGNLKNLNLKVLISIRNILYKKREFKNCLRISIDRNPYFLM